MPVRSQIFTMFLGINLMIQLFSLAMPSSTYATPAIQSSSISQNKSTLSTYEKFEISFDITNIQAENYQFPYLSTTDANQYLQKYKDKGISVGAIFTNPNGQEFYQPGFYYQEYMENAANGTDWIYPTGNLYWVVRFSPNIPGNWKYRLVAHDKGGRSESSQFNFTVTDSGKKGFLKVSESDSRYFEFDNGEYFSSLGYEKEISSESQLQELQANGINSIREWISSDGIFGSQWGRWVRSPRTYDGYLPRVPIVAADPENDGSLDFYYYLRHYPAGGSNWFTACMNLDDQNQYPYVKPNTNYYLEIEYKGSNLQRNNSNPYGVVAKTVEWFEEADCMKSGIGNNITNYGTNQTSFDTIKGVWNSGNRKSLPKLFIALENNRTEVASLVHIKSISIKEMTGGTVNSPTLVGPNLIDEPFPNQLEYMEQSSSYQLDKKLDYMEKYDVYARWVVLEKEEELFKKIGLAGIDGTSTVNNFYGQDRNHTASRFLQEAWFRYLQARWGYSTKIMAWELVNEGDPTKTSHYALTDEMGKTFKCRAFDIDISYSDGAPCNTNHPNTHMVSTSFWHSFPGSSFWENSKYPNVDFADVHAYVSTSYAPLIEREKMQYDAAYFHYWHSKDLASWNIGKPIIRGEAGMDSPAQQSHTVLNIQRDTQGIWLHNYNWASLYSGGLIETYWWVGEHIDYGTVDNRFKFQLVNDFLQNIPLNNGNYQDAQAIVSNDSNSLIRAWGQKDLVNGFAHLWVQNSKHTWKNVVDGVNVPSVSPTLKIEGFQPNKQYRVEWWNTYERNPANKIYHAQNISTDSTGTITLTANSTNRLQNLSTDLAVKIINLDNPIPTTQPTPTNTPSPTPTTKPGLIIPTAVSDSSNDGNLPENTIDQNLETRWSSEGIGQWIQFDLGSIQHIGSIQIAWYRGDTRSSTIDILGSTDGQTWNTIQSQVASGTASGFEPYEFTTTQLRYLRIVGHGNTESAWNSINEVEIYQGTLNTNYDPKFDLNDDGSVNIIDLLEIVKSVLLNNLSTS